MKTTNHASKRQQQRGIPQLIVALVRTYGILPADVYKTKLTALMALL